MACFVVISDDPLVAAAVPAEFPRRRRIQDGVWAVEAEDAPDVCWRLGLRTTRRQKRQALTGLVLKVEGHMGTLPQEAWDDFQKWGRG